MLESDFIKSHEFNPFVWYRYIDYIFFIWTHGEEKRESLVDDLIKYHPNIKYTHEVMVLKNRIPAETCEKRYYFRSKEFPRKKQLRRESVKS